LGFKPKASDKGQDMKHAEQSGIDGTIGQLVGTPSNQKYVVVNINTQSEELDLEKVPDELKESGASADEGKTICSLSYLDKTNAYSHNVSDKTFHIMDQFS